MCYIGETACPGLGVWLSCVGTGIFFVDTEFVMALPIGLQLYTVRDVLGEDLDAGLGEVASIGYRYVELAGLHGRTAEAFGGLLDKHGLTAVAAHESGDDLLNDIPAVVRRAEVLGYRYVVFPYLDEAQRCGYGELAGRLAESARELGEHGLTLCYHNHDFEWEAEGDGKRGVDHLFDGTELNSELDVYWVKKAGDDPLDWMKKLSGRLPILHMKDMADTAERGFAEVGTGTIDFGAILGAAEGCGVRYLIVEQDGNWKDSPMESARVGFENLGGMLV
jgi:sugar phosphate isomerase/epimerase